MFEPNGLARLGRRLPGGPKQLSTCRVARFHVLEVEELVRTLGFYHQKAKNIIRTCQIIVAEFGGKVPDTMEGLTSLPGVARKTANIVLGEAFGE